MTTDVGQLILNHLADHNGVDTLDLAPIFNVDHQRVIGAVKSLQSLGNVVTAEPKTLILVELTKEGVEVVKGGSHEALVFNAVPEDGIDQSEIMKNVPNAKIGFSKAMSNGWITIDKSSGKPLVRRKVQSINDEVQKNLGDLKNLPQNVKQEYKKRKLIEEVTVKSLLLSKGPDFGLSIEKQETELTAEMLASGSWQTKTFKDYNFNALGVQPDFGALHPLMKVRAEFRKIFLEMGFEEMATNNYVESSFWNFDALYQPQQHPARDAHDTFFISHPKTSRNYPKEYMEKVKKVHSSGGYGSIGYQYEWKEEEAEKNLLRTHTTAVTARMLYRLAQEKEFRPVRYFSIDRVYRNETLDATHLAEFFQVEGIVADRNITLGHLIGILHTFFQKLGIEKLTFKPAYNPYTEPSMEIFSFHPGLQKWIEVGNSGMFRPEMLRPMGLPEDVNVLGWGLSLERPTMIKYGISNIRDLEGPKVDLQLVRDGPICRLDK